MAEGHGGSAQTLRDYWEGHGHPGPSHGAERDEIRWGTPGDFMRCVAQVTAHGHMTEEEAKGYCNLRHHGATGEWPAQHAKRDKMAADDEVTLIHVEGEGDTDHDGDGLFDADGDGDGAVATLVRKKKRSANKAADGSGEARVPAGHVTGGQFTVGGDGPTKTPPKPNPYGKKKGKKGKGPAGKKGKTDPGKKAARKPRPPESRQDRQADRQERHSIRQRIASLESRLAPLLKEERSLRGSGVSGRASTRTGTRGSSVSPAARSSTAQSSKPSSSGTSKPGTSAKPQSKLAQVQAQIRQLRAQIAAARQQLAAVKAWEGDVNKGTSVRDRPTGRFRTFEGESKEAANAFQEGRVHDAVDFLGSARALATDPGHRTTLDSLQRHVARLQHVIPEVTKGFIRGDSIAHGDKTGFHEGSAGGGHVYLRTRDGVRHRVPAHEIRATRDDENEDLYRQESDPGLPQPEEDTKSGSR